MLIAPEIFEKLKQYNEDDNLKGAVNQDSKSIKAIYKELVKYKRLSVEFFKGSRESLLDFFSEYKKSSFRQLSEFNSNMIQKYKAKMEEIIVDTFGGITHEVKAVTKSLFIMGLIGGAIYAWFNRDKLVPDSEDIKEDFEVLQKNIKHFSYLLYSKSSEFFRNNEISIAFNNFIKTNNEVKKGIINNGAAYFKDIFYAFFINFYANLPKALGTSLSKNLFEPIYNKMSVIFKILAPTLDTEKDLRLSGEGGEYVFFQNTKYFKLENFKDHSPVSFLENIVPDRDDYTLDTKEEAEAIIKKLRKEHKILSDNTNLKNETVKSILYGDNSKFSSILLSEKDIDIDNFHKELNVKDIDDNFAKQLYVHISLYTIFYNLSEEERNRYIIKKSLTLSEDKLAVIIKLLENEKYNLIFKPNILNALNYAKQYKQLIVEASITNNPNNDNAVKKRLKDLLDKGIFNERFQDIVNKKGSKELQEKLKKLEKIKKESGDNSIKKIRNNQYISGLGSQKEKEKFLDEIIEEASTLILENTVSKKGKRNRFLNVEEEIALELSESNDLGKVKEDFSTFSEQEKEFLKDISNATIDKINNYTTKNNVTYKVAFGEHYPHELSSLLDSTLEKFSKIKLIENVEEKSSSTTNFVITKIDKFDKEMAIFVIKSSSRVEEINEKEKKLIKITDDIVKILANALKKHNPNIFLSI